MPIITKRFLDAITGDGKLRIIRDDELTGFGVQVTPQGGISFCVTYSVGTKSRRKVIGRFGPLTVEKARKLALSHLATAAQGSDPLPETDLYFATVGELFEAWMQRHVAVNLKPNSARAYRKSFENHGRSRFGHLAPSKLDHAMFAAARDEMKDTPILANHMLRTMRAMLSWATSQGFVQWSHGNPSRGHRLFRETPTDRILTVSEIRAFIAGLPAARMDGSTRQMLLLELLLGQRSGEIAAMRKTDIDLVAATWTIVENKSDRPHVVPLPPWSREILAAALKNSKGLHVFPSPVGGSENQDSGGVDSHALGTALRRAQRPVDKKGKPVPGKHDKNWVFDFRDREGKPNPISPHDLRRTCSSYLELLGFGDFIRGAILNHSQRRNVTAKHYSAADLLKLKRTALLQWEVAVRRIVAGEHPFSSVLEDDRAEEQRVLESFRATKP